MFQYIIALSEYCLFALSDQQLIVDYARLLDYMLEIFPTTSLLEKSRLVWSIFQGTITQGTSHC